MAPGIGYLIPWFILFTKAGMIDTYSGPHPDPPDRGLAPGAVGDDRLLRGRARRADRVSRLDGCSHWSAFLRVALPLAKPGIVATGILSFIFSWNNFLFSLIIAGFKTRTLPIAVYSFLSYEEINWGGLTAAATIITLPVLILAMLVQKHIVRGLTFGALKG